MGDCRFYEGFKHILYCDGSRKSLEFLQELKEKGYNVDIHKRPGKVPILDAVDKGGNQVSPHFIGYERIRTLYLNPNN